jgi:alkanesulfonate monooxygenase SsuD/methylene tetrahydromethanopterin reductase-like flavin-dependent oxidoreductase (luciferase family)
VATAVAARTTRLRVGTSVILLPLHHPVHVAEDVITLDLVSKGRIILGVGIGYQPADFRAFSVPMADRAGRFAESIEICAGAPGERFSFHGKHYTLRTSRSACAPTRNRDRRCGSAPASTPPRVGGRTPTASWARPAPARQRQHPPTSTDAAREAAARPKSSRCAMPAGRSRAEVDPSTARTMTAYRYYWENRPAEPEPRGRLGSRWRARARSPDPK